MCLNECSLLNFLKILPWISISMVDYFQCTIFKDGLFLPAVLPAIFTSKNSSRVIKFSFNLFQEKIVQATKKNENENFRIFLRKLTLNFFREIREIRLKFSTLIYVQDSTLNTNRCENRNAENNWIYNLFFQFHIYDFWNRFSSNKN